MNDGHWTGIFTTSQKQSVALRTVGLSGDLETAVREIVDVAAVAAAG